MIGLPLGAMLCFERGLGAPGLWMGLSAGLIAIGVVLTAFWWRTARVRREMAVEKRRVIKCEGLVDFLPAR